MIISVLDIIRRAMQDIGAISKSEVPSADEMADGLEDLNMMIDAWSVRSLMVMGTILEGFALTAGRQQYFIGTVPGATFQTPRPSAITEAFVRDGNRQDTGLDILVSGEWNSITDKAISTGRPQALYYDPGPTQASLAMGVINIYPAPDASSPYTLYLGERKPLTEFSSLTDTVTFPPAYYEALRYNLAIRLWPQYHDGGKAVEQDLKDLAVSSMHAVEKMNAKQVTAAIEVPGGRKGGYNIYTGGY